jgi:hypothetical protein
MSIKNFQATAPVVTALVAVMLVTAHVIAIAPVVIMIYGPPLTEPVFITEVRFFHDVNNPTRVTASDLVDRPFMKLAMFWGPDYQRYVDDPTLLSQLKPEQAGQHGRLYLRTATEPAMVIQTPVLTAGVVNPAPIPTDVRAFTWGGVITDAQAKVMRAAGVPVDFTR